MNAAAASERNDLLDKILPSTMEDYVAMVQSHLVGGDERKIIFINNS